MSVFVTPLTPLAFLERAAAVYRDAPAVVDGERRATYGELGAHATRLAGALRASGVAPGDRVAYLCRNRLELLVAHFAVPLAGAVLVALNTRLAAPELRALIEHSGARLLVADASAPAAAALAGAGRPASLHEIAWADPPPDAGGIAYDDLLARGSGEPPRWGVDDEHATISINYTSGTTGGPKGVMYTHRGAYLNALGEVATAGLGVGSAYLWTLPMFHCNGWCHPWAVTAAGGVHVMPHEVRGPELWRLIDREGITHMAGAPPVLAALAGAEEARPLDRPLVVMTAAAPPNPVVLAQVEALGARVIHVYGLTETYGPHTVCAPQRDWTGRPAEERARLLARQGVAMVMADPIRVVDADGRDVPADGRTMGEVVMTGNNVMKGYFRDPEATERAFRGGVFRSGDLAVMHPDGYIELRDRAKDIVISGGENISTIEVEQAIASHPAVAEAAVVGVPDERWGERPKAFVVLRAGRSATPGELAAHVRALLAGFKCPDRFELVEALPRTSTGKVRKHELRRAEREGRAPA